MMLKKAGIYLKRLTLSVKWKGGYETSLRLVISMLSNKLKDYKLLQGLRQFFKTLRPIQPSQHFFLTTMYFHLAITMLFFLVPEKFLTMWSVLYWKFSSRGTNSVIYSHTLKDEFVLYAMFTVFISQIQIRYIHCSYVLCAVSLPILKCKVCYIVLKDVHYSSALKWYHFTIHDIEIGWWSLFPQPTWLEQHMKYVTWLHFPLSYFCQILLST